MLKMSGRDDISDGVMRELSRLAPQLNAVELSDCAGMSTEAFGLMLSGAGRLTALDLSGCYLMGDE